MKLPPDNCPVYNHIDLKRHLPTLRSSLSPRHPVFASLSLPVSQSPRLVTAREEAHRFARRAQWFLIGFFVLVLAILAHHRALLPLLGL